MRSPTLATTAAVLLINASIYIGYHRALIAREVAIESAGGSEQVAGIVDQWVAAFVVLMILLVSIPSLFALCGSKAARGWLTLVTVVGTGLAFPAMILDPSLMLAPQTVLPVIGLILLYVPARQLNGHTALA